MANMFTQVAPPIDWTIDRYMPQDFMPDLDLMGSALAANQKTFDDTLMGLENLKQLLPESMEGFEPYRQQLEQEVNSLVGGAVEEVMSKGKLSGGQHEFAKIANQIVNNDNFKLLQKANQFRETVMKNENLPNFQNYGAKWKQEPYDPNKHGSIAQYLAYTGEADYAKEYLTDVKTYVLPKLISPDLEGTGQLIRLSEDEYMYKEGDVTQTFSADVVKEAFEQGLGPVLYETGNKPGRDYRSLVYEEKTGNPYNYDAWVEDHLNAAVGHFRDVTTPGKTKKYSVGKGSSSRIDELTKQDILSPQGVIEGISSQSSFLKLEEEGLTEKSGLYDFESVKDNLQRKISNLQDNVVNHVLNTPIGQKVSSALVSENGENLIQLETDEDGVSRITLPTAKELEDRLKELPQYKDSSLNEIRNDIDRLLGEVSKNNSTLYLETNRVKTLNSLYNEMSRLLPGSKKEDYEAMLNEASQITVEDYEAQGYSVSRLIDDIRYGEIQRGKDYGFTPAVKKVFGTYDITIDMVTDGNGNLNKKGLEVIRQTQRLNVLEEITKDMKDIGNSKLSEVIENYESLFENQKLGNTMYLLHSNNKDTKEVKNKILESVTSIALSSPQTKVRFRHTDKPVYSEGKNQIDLTQSIYSYLEGSKYTVDGKVKDIYGQQGRHMGIRYDKSGVMTADILIPLDAIPEKHRDKFTDPLTRYVEIELDSNNQAEIERLTGLDAISRDIDTAKIQEDLLRYGAGKTTMYDGTQIEYNRDILHPEKPYTVTINDREFHVENSKEVASIKALTNKMLMAKNSFEDNEPMNINGKNVIVDQNVFASLMQNYTIEMAKMTGNPQIAMNVLGIEDVESFMDQASNMHIDMNTAEESYGYVEENYSDVLSFDASIVTDNGGKSDYSRTIVSPKGKELISDIGDIFREAGAKAEITSVYRDRSKQKDVTIDDNKDHKISSHERGEALDLRTRGENGKKMLEKLTSTGRIVDKEGNEINMKTLQQDKVYYITDESGSGKRKYKIIYESYLKTKNGVRGEHLHIEPYKI